MGAGLEFSCSLGCSPVFGDQAAENLPVLDPGGDAGGSARPTNRSRPVRERELSSRYRLHERALMIYRDLGGRFGEASTLIEVGPPSRGKHTQRHERHHVRVCRTARSSRSVPAGPPTRTSGRHPHN